MQTQPQTFVLEPAPVQPPGILPDDDIPEFKAMTPGDSPESIFSNDHGEDLFAPPAPKPEIPIEPPPPPLPGTGFAPYPPPDALATPPAPELPPSGDTSPFELSPLPDDGTAVAAAAIDNAIIPMETSQPAAVENPESAWTTSEPAPPVIEEPAPAAIDEPNAFADSTHLDHGPDLGMPPEPRMATAPERKRQSFSAITFLAPYALVATLLAGWFGYQYYTLRSKHPLENIPDIIGDNDPARRNPHKQATERTIRLPSPDQPLPDKLKVPLGQTIRIGSLEVRPLRIEQKKFQFTTVYESGALETRNSPNAALVLHVRLKNVSDDEVFHPTDPFFDRQYIAEQHRSKPYVFLEVGSERFYGGPFNYLGFRRDSKNPRKRVFATGQENDEKPLLPGEERETCFYTFPDSEGKLLAAAHAFKDTIVWRLQLRRGLMDFKSREYSMCAVVGVQFTAADIVTTQ